MGTTTVSVAQGASNTAFGGTLNDGAVRTLSLVKAGAGTLTLTGTQAYTGLTAIMAGTIRLGDGTTDGSIANGSNILNNGTLNYNSGKSAAAAANVVFDGGTLQYTGGTVASDRAFTINAGKTATIEVTNDASNLALAGATGAATSGALTKTGSGTLSLTGASTHTGATVISAGTLQLGNGGITGLLSRRAA